MSEQLHPGRDSLSPSLLQRVDELCDRFEDAWIAGQRPRIEDYLNDTPEPERPLLLQELLSLELVYGCRSGETLNAEDYVRRFPEHAEIIRAVFAKAVEGERAKEAVSSSDRASTGPVPVRLGRYKIERVLGQGGFGLVYLADDEQLSRPVAIKVPHAHLVAQPGDAEAYLAEARTVANLDHPNIVPVFDVGSADQFPFFVVSKYIDGSNLTAKTKASRLSLEGCAELVAIVAEALHYAHKQGIVHRDIKPANILLDKNGKPFVADFGLALREQDVGKGPRYAGTPAYMSPEQARGEGHRVDGRSDIFSLGVVLYELLTGRRPFKAESAEEVLKQIVGLEARPARQIDDGIPKELDRICLKALAKRTSERYSTAKDMADDLRHFLAVAPDEERSAVTGGKTSEADLARPMLSPVPTPSDHQAIKIVPKGLRSFDSGDAHFFLELLPGPQDRDGLPESIRFWKNRIEQVDPDQTFSVGLIYGPSGCGKSSLVKAGLLPRLAKQVMAVYVEATAEQTEARLLKGLRRQVADLPADLGLVESLAALRRGRFLASGQKVLLLLDQFEQWLHAKRNEENSELVQALRQCDGGRVQCVVMMRDDFWLAVSRFMQALEIRVVEGENSRLIDLFDLMHARKVLCAFGRAYGRLPDNLGQCSKEQDAFLDQAVAGLAQKGKVISVRLALFAEMVKGKPWTPTTLKEIGGTEGVGVTFLEETFTASTAPPQHRQHQKAAQAVLKALLPEAGTDIRGNMRTHQELLEASDCGRRPKKFEDLVCILDTELRLVTPTDPEDCDDVEGKEETETSVKQYYQLSHDYLVPALREWLTRKQRETRRGRAELRLAELTVFWRPKFDKRYLPTLWEWLRIILFTRRRDWTSAQCRMMWASGRSFALRGLLYVVVVAAGGWSALEVVGNWWASYLVKTVRTSFGRWDARESKNQALLSELKTYRRWTIPALKEMIEKDPDHGVACDASAILVQVDPAQVNYLCARFLKADWIEYSALRRALRSGPRKEINEITERLWDVLEDSEAVGTERIRAACWLARADWMSSRWARVSNGIDPQFLKIEPSHFNQLIATDPDFVADLVTDFLHLDIVTFEMLLAQWKRSPPDRLLARLDLELRPPVFQLGSFVIVEGDVPSHLWEIWTRRRSNAAMALVYLDQVELIWRILKQVDEPITRSYLIHALSFSDLIPPKAIQRFWMEEDVSMQRALLLLWGEYTQRDRNLDIPNRVEVLTKLVQVYRENPDPGVHSALEWVWRSVNGRVIQPGGKGAMNPEASAVLRKVDQELVSKEVLNNRRWYISGQGHTLAVVSVPIEFWSGLPEHERDRAGIHGLESKRILRSYAIGTKEVTVEQFGRFLSTNPTIRVWYAEARAKPDEPITSVTWFEAAQYCRWLSEQAGTPEDEMCYPPISVIENAKQGHTKLVLPADYLRRTGYRLPTEVEWQYACRPDRDRSSTWSLGTLPKYAWFAGNANGQAHPVGQLKPNDLGLFDMYGNAAEWCYDAHMPNPQNGNRQAEGLMIKHLIEDSERSIAVSVDTPRVIRGGSFNSPAASIRSAQRDGKLPTVRDSSIGFRVARTYR